MSSDHGPESGLPSPGNIIVEPILSDAEMFMGTIDPIAQDYGAALKSLRDIVRVSLSDETLLAAATPECPWLALDDRDSRRRNTQTMRELREDVIYQTVLAKNDAQVAEIGDRIEDRQDAEAEALRQQEAMANGEGLNAFFGAVWVNVYHAERRKIQLEKQLMTHTLNLVNADPKQLIEVLTIVTDPEADTEDHKPFLQYLAKNHFDPFEVSILDTVLENLEEAHSLTLPGFLDQLHGCYAADAETREASRVNYPEEILEWFDLFARTLQQADGSPVLPGVMLIHVPVAMWPSSVREAFLSEHRQLLGSVRQQYMYLLEPLQDSSNFFISDDQLDQVKAASQARIAGVKPTKSTKRKSSSGRRVTQRTRASDFVVSKIEDEPRAVNTVAEMAQTPNGHVHAKAVDLDAIEEDELDDTLLSLGPVADYLREKSSDPDIRRDLLSMLHSLIDQPRGNGSQKTTDMQVSISFGGRSNNKRMPVWRLNPNQRTDLSIGDTARQTRIYFTITRGDEGQTTVGILGVRHKASSEKLRGFWSRK